MPYLSDYGMGGLVDSVRHVGSGIRGAIGGYMDRSREVEQEQRALDEQNRVLPTNLNKWMQKVMSGEMTGAQAAAAAHDEGASSPATVDPTRLTDDEGPSSGATVGAEGSMIPQQKVPSLRGAVAAPVINREPPMYTVRDLGYAQKIAAMQKDMRPPVDHMELERLRQEGRDRNTKVLEGGRNARAENALMSREEAAEKMLAFKYWEVEQRARMKIQELEASMERLKLKTASNEDIEKAKILMQEAVAEVRGMSQIASSIVNQTPQAAEQLIRLQQAYEMRIRQIGALLDQPSKAGEPGSDAKGPVYNPTGAGMDPELGKQQTENAKKIIEENKTVRERTVSGTPPAAPRPAGAPPKKAELPKKDPKNPSGTPPIPLGRFKTDAKGVRWEEMSDGSARRVN